MTYRFALTFHGDGIVSLPIATDHDRYLDEAWLHSFSAALEALGEDESVRVVILEGGGRYFCAGASRDSLLASVAGAWTYAARIPHLLLDLPIPIVAAMAGHAIGGGLVLGLWCDGLVMSAESLYGANFMALGFPPGMGATFAVPEAFGASLGRELLWSGRLMTGREIRDACCPLSHAVHSRAEVFRRALALGREMAETPPDSARLFKRQLAVGRRARLGEALAAEEAGHTQQDEDSALRQEVARRYWGDASCR